MPDPIRDQLDNFGFAEVIVVLQQSELSAALGEKTVDSAALSASFELGVADALAQYFIVPPDGQAAGLARMATKSRSRDGELVALGDGEAVEAELPKVRVYPFLGVALGTVSEDGLARLESDPRVREVHAAPPISPIRPVDIGAAKKVPMDSWGIKRLRVRELWSRGITGKGVLVGHLDTGVDASHPALTGAVSAFAEFDMNGNQIPNAAARDSESHGTHTAGTIAGRTVGETTFGIAPEAMLMSALVIERGDVVARVLGGMNWAVGQGVSILSMSLGFRQFTTAFQALTQQLRLRNVLPVFAVGNEGVGRSRSPGNYSEALSVGACDEQDMMWEGSGSQRFTRAADPLVPDLVAPGACIFSCTPGGQYALKSGTSMATPHVAGLAALLFQAKPGATVDEVEAALFGSCDLAGLPADRANRGLPSAPRAFEILTGTQLSALPTVSAAVDVQPTEKAQKRGSTRRGTKASSRRSTSRG